MPIWNGDCAIMPWLVLGASQRWGSRVVQVVVGSHWSGLRESSCQSQSAAGQSLGCITSGAAWSVVSLQGQRVGSFGHLLPPPPNGGRHGVAGVVGSWVLPPI
jgi:hypothetical protein